MPPLPPRREGLPNPPGSGERKQTPTPGRTSTVKVANKGAFEPFPAEPRLASATAPAVEETNGNGHTNGNGLPFTGARMLAWLVVGFALLAGGLLLWRRTSTVSTAVELSTDAEPPAVVPDPRPGAGRLPSRGALVLRSLGLVACGMLLFRGTRR